MWNCVGLKLALGRDQSVDFPRNAGRFKNRPRSRLLLNKILSFGVIYIRAMGAVTQAFTRVSAAYYPTLSLIK